MFSLVIAAPFICLIAFFLITGEIRGRRGRRIRRSDSPVLYWFLIVLFSSLGLYMSMMFYEVDASNAETRRKVEEFKQSHREKTVEDEMKEIREDQAEKRDQKAVEDFEGN